MVRKKKSNLRVLNGFPSGPINKTLNTRHSWTPLRIFRFDEAGAWYDPSDLSTLFQDSAGTTPVTADGDPSGRMLDKSGNGNHATQTVSADRLLYQRGDSRGVVNLLKWSEAFDNAVWLKGTRNSITSNVTTAPDGTVTADKIIGANTNDDHFMDQVVPSLSSGVSATTSFRAKAAEYTYVVFRYAGIGAFAGAAKTIVVNLSNGTVSSSNFSSESVVDKGDGWYEITATAATVAAGSLTYRINPSITGLATELHDGVSGIYIWGAQLEQASTPTTYQRNDSHLGGVGTGSASDLHWLADDKVDDDMDVPVSIPAATVAFADSSGVTIDYPVDLTSGYTIDMDSSPHGFGYGWVIIDRELTAIEIARVTAYLSKKAGL